MTDAPETAAPPVDVAAQHARYDRHADDRVRLFQAVTSVLPGTATVLYPGSFIDIGPSVWFDRVAYVDTDRRAARFFAHADGVPKRGFAPTAGELHRINRGIAYTRTAFAYLFRRSTCARSCTR